MYFRRINRILHCHCQLLVKFPKRNQSMKAVQNMSKTLEIPVQTDNLLKQTKGIVVPKLDDKRHKGQYGRVGVVGGSLEYTGAPYFAALSSLKVGADLAHVFCQRDAAVVIKSFSPELIVHPLLDKENALEEIEPWLERLHVVIIGPGLGRDPSILKTTAELIKLCLQKDKPLVIDADGLFLLSESPELIKGQRNIILTPNAIEFKRLFGETEKQAKGMMYSLGDGVVVLEKGAKDKVHIANTGETYLLPPGGSGRRCGGQGDLLSGSLATFFHWAVEAHHTNPAFIASFAASYLIKASNAYAFKKMGRSMLASDMLNEIPVVFRDVFENTKV